MAGGLVVGTLLPFLFFIITCRAVRGPSAFVPFKTHQRSHARARIRGYTRLLSTSSPIEQFLTKLDQSLLDETFVRLSVTKNNVARDPQAIEKLQARLISSSSGARFQFVYTHPTSTTTKNYDMKAAETAIRDVIMPLPAEKTSTVADFKSARLFTTQKDHILEAARRQPEGLKYYTNKPTFTTAEVTAHDRPKKRRLQLLQEVTDGEIKGFRGDGSKKEEKSFLYEYGILAKDTQKPKAGMRDKYRQMEKFVEILDSLLKNEEGGGARGALRQTIGEETPISNRPLRLLDAGCGKGYLTFAAYEFLTAQGYNVQATGIDLRQDVVDKANVVAERLGYSPGLKFVQGGIAELVHRTGASSSGDKDQEESNTDGDGRSNYDIVIALHACDTATDDTLHLAVAMGARIILSSPCCHKEVRRNIKKALVPSSSFSSNAVVATEQHHILRHGILLERQAEIITDAIRVLCLDIAGYKSQVIEFINDEATSKNLMITATKRSGRESTDAKHSRERRLQELKDLMSYWGISSQKLVRLLGLEERRDPEM